MRATQYRYADIDGRELFYREASPAGATALVLLHGFPTSSYMFRDLIPLLADRHHVIAPDHLGFGLSGAPPTMEFGYTFTALAGLIAGLPCRLGVTRYAMYVHDYGGPVGWRLALADPDAISAIITQNGNGYDAGFTEGFWKPLRACWQDQNPQTEAAVRQALTPEAIGWQYLHGVPDQSVVSPDSWYHDFALVSRPSNDLAGPCSPTTPATCGCIRSCTSTCVTEGFRCWPSGAPRTRYSDRTAPAPSPPTRPAPTFTCSMAATSCSKAIWMPSAVTSAASSKGRCRDRKPERPDRAGYRAGQRAGTRCCPRRALDAGGCVVPPAVTRKLCPRPTPTSVLFVLVNTFLTDQMLHIDGGEPFTWPNPPRPYSAQAHQEARGVQNPATVLVNPKTKDKHPTERNVS
jgi:pimeloyl-ACP methyl ester carboxylesterase